MVYVTVDSLDITTYSMRLITGGAHGQVRPQCRRFHAFRDAGNAGNDIPMFPRPRQFPMFAVVLGDDSNLSVTFMGKLGTEIS